ncbi:unnamed protein product [Cylindrotheca closterium]|uniref:Uncharacterized protein n=1 Tax=Cylindrotheca closterium TaxID=2856 RepID=A0AAD2G2A8_9STRA|nr:unnamed protein product [Cylindrotheca closterium]
MQELCSKVKTQGVSFIQQYYLNKGLKLFKDCGKKAAIKELDQLVKQQCWDPVHVEELTKKEKEKAVGAMILLAKKHTGEVKGRCVYKDRPRILQLCYVQERQEGTLCCNLQGCLWYAGRISTLLQEIRADLEGVGFNFNPYDPFFPCGRFVVKPHNAKSQWLNETYGSYKECTSTRGKVHVYLGMTLDFSKEGKLKICMDDYRKQIG